MRVLKAMLTMAAFVMGFCIQAHAEDKILINGAGATFPAPIYSKWFQEYNKSNPKIEINYQSIGSGGGIKQLTAKTVDFGASDAPMSDTEITAAGGNVLHIPTVLGAVTITYNVPGVKSALSLDGATVAELFSGKITKWNDAKIKTLNKGVALPDTAVVPVYRSDSSGTTSVFTEYLAKVSPEWKSGIGQGKTVKWPAGLGGKGNEGVTGQVKNTPGSVGYVELAYAMAEKLPIAMIKNKAGQYVLANLESVSAAAAGALKSMPEDFRVSITDADGKGSYPIAAFTYLLVYKDMPGTKGEEFVKFLNWAMDAGQKQASTLQYAQLPTPMVVKVKEKIKTITTK
ncbi:MAG: phosphate ABC transporter substrate-binding protein PstS [Bdellovibrionota bacterium]